MNSNNYMFLVITEFGRTNKSNGGGGTDHADATTVIVGGDKVKNGVYNMDDPSGTPSGYGTFWPLILAKRGLDYLTDFRTVYAEILQDKFKLPNQVIDDEILRQQFTGTLGSTPALRKLGFVLP